MGIRVNKLHAYYYTFYCSLSCIQKISEFLHLINANILNVEFLLFYNIEFFKFECDYYFNMIKKKLGSI